MYNSLLGSGLWPNTVAIGHVSENNLFANDDLL